MGQAEQPQTVAGLLDRLLIHAPYSDLEQFQSAGKLQDAVVLAVAPDGQLGGDQSVAAVEEERGVGAQAPGIPVLVIQVGHDERPVRPVPVGLVVVLWHEDGVSGDVIPSRDDGFDLLIEQEPRQLFLVEALFRADDRPAGVLLAGEEFSQRLYARDVILDSRLYCNLAHISIEFIRLTSLISVAWMVISGTALSGSSGSPPAAPAPPCRPRRRWRSCLPARLSA